MDRPPAGWKFCTLRPRAAALAADQRAEWATFNAALGSGSPVGIAAGPGRLDWQHAWNPKYGGVTGGGFRRQWHGVDAVATAEPATVRRTRAETRYQALASKGMFSFHAIQICPPAACS